jgi:hypothetical protein
MIFLAGLRFLRHIEIPSLVNVLGLQTGLFFQECGRAVVAAPAQNEQNAEIRVYQVH